MKKLLSIILSIVLTLTLFTSCGSVDIALASTYLNLGEKYLADSNYEEAIDYFNKLIEVEPTNERAYLGEAEAYVALDDTDGAIAILEQGIEAVEDPTEIQAMLAELLGESEVENEVIADEVVTEEDATPEADITQEETIEDNETREEDELVITEIYYYESDGSVDYWQEYEYNSDGVLTKVTVYTADQRVSNYNVYEHDSDGKLASWESFGSENELTSSGEYEYDSNGNMVKMISYDLSGNVTLECDSEYDEEGNRVKVTMIENSWRYVIDYNSRGDLVSGTAYSGETVTSEMHYENEYDEDGKLIRTEGYDADGNISEYYECEYGYDSSGRIISETITSYQNDTLYSIEYQSRTN
ncbi:MAG: tetratricopeptide repeat protein [Oscillospiraceae bacterium]|nr:tetratricopeptide repeat protein [Oscillospiraceae bacterium]